MVKLTCFMDKIHINLPELLTQPSPTPPPPTPVKTTEKKESPTTSKKTVEKRNEEDVLKKESSKQSSVSKESKPKVSADESDMKLKRRAALSVEKAQRALRNRQLQNEYERAVVESRNDVSSEQKVDHSSSPSCKSNKVAGTFASSPRENAGKEDPHSSYYNGAKEVTSISRTLQRPHVVKHPYRYMQGQKKEWRDSTPELDWKLEPRNDKDIIKTFQDQIPDLADKIMKDIERSFGRSSLHSGDRDQAPDSLAAKKY